MIAPHKPPCPGPEAHITHRGRPSCAGHCHPGPDAEPDRLARDGMPCANHPMRGQDVCKSHGGASPQAKKTATQRLELQKVEADAKALLAHRGDQPITDPLGDLAKLAAEVTAFKDAIAARVNSLDQIRYLDAKGAEQLRSEIAMYERAMDRTGKFLEVLVRAGFEERMTRLSEQHGALIIQVLQRVFAAMDLTPEQLGLVPTVVPAALRTISGEVAS